MIWFGNLIIISKNLKIGSLDFGPLEFSTELRPRRLLSKAEESSNSFPREERQQGTIRPLHQCALLVNGRALRPFLFCPAIELLRVTAHAK